MEGIIIGIMLICLRMKRVYIIKWYATLADPTIIIGDTGRYIIRLRIFFGIEGSKLACDTGGHFTNYPTWPLPRTNPNVDILNN